MTDHEPLSESGLNFPENEEFSTSYDSENRILEVLWLQDEFVEQIFRFPEAEQLWLQNTVISDNGLATLSRLSNIRVIDISAAAIIRGSGLAAWVDHPRLDQLVAINTLIDDQSIVHVGNIEKLWNLDLGSTRVTDAGLESLIGLRNLRRLHLQDTAITDIGINVISRSIPTLEWLTLDQLNLSTNAVGYLARLPALRTLSFGGNSLGAECISRISALNLLELLDMRYSHIAVSSLPELKWMACLKSLSFWNVRLDGADLSWISELTRLQHLNLGFCQLNDQDIRTLALGDQVYELNLSSNYELTDKSLHILQEFPHLRKLDIHSCSITREGSARLRSRLPNTEIIDDFSYRGPSAFTYDN